MTNQGQNNFWVLLDVLARRRRLFMTIVLSTTILATITAFVLPKWYKAEALLLPPKDISAPISGLKDLTDVASVTQGLDLPLLATPSDVYARILKSRAIADTVMRVFDLINRYEAENADETYNALMENAEFKVTDEGLLLVTVEDKDPQMAAQMANRFIDELDRINSRITQARGSENRRFIEERLAKVKSELDSARKELQDFQTSHRTVDFDEQTRLAIDHGHDRLAPRHQAERGAAAPAGRDLPRRRAPADRLDRPGRPASLEPSRTQPVPTATEASTASPTR